LSLDSLLSRWKTDSATAPNFAAWRTLPARLADLVPLPPLPDPLPAALSRRGIHALYRHQFASFESARRGENVVLATGTASGKTLAYNLPVLATLIENPQARALCLFPTKALTQDQFSVISNQLSVINELRNTQYSQQFTMGIPLRLIGKRSARPPTSCSPIPICSTRASCRITPTGTNSSVI
jgi:DEAD/DEAH box helicase domain-containing protein